MAQQWWNATKLLTIADKYKQGMSASQNMPVSINYQTV
jgi:hypothetical protein